MPRPSHDDLNSPVLRLNAICPYFTMFPLSFPLGVITDHRDKSAWVLDPFCGRGTTNFASRVLGIPTVGFDVSPVAVAIARAKMVLTSSRDIVQAAEDIFSSVKAPKEIPGGPFWELAYHPDVLLQLCILREELVRDSVSPARAALLGIIMGALHGPLSKRNPTYLSNQAPRTFAPKPSYAVKYWQEHGMVPPKVDLLEVIRVRAERYYSSCPPSVQSVVTVHDSRQPLTESVKPLLDDLGHGSLVITSPPYLGMRTYIPDQWLRNWFVGGPAQVDYSTAGQLGSERLHQYTMDLNRVWKNVADCCRSGAKMVVRFGCMSSLEVDAESVFRNSIYGTGWRLTETVPAGDSRRGKRQADAFSCSKRAPVMEFDAYCVLE